MPRLGDLSGYLLTSKYYEITREQLLEVSNLAPVTAVVETGWEEFRFTANRPLRNEAALGKGPPYVYKVLCRRGAKQTLLLSESKSVIQRLLRYELAGAFTPPPRRVAIGVDGLVRSMASKPGRRYTLSRVHARLPAFGESLKAVSYYGSDIAEGALFRANMELLSCYGCALRNSSDGRETMRIRSDGLISVPAPMTSHLPEVEKAIVFIRERGFLEGL